MSRDHSAYAWEHPRVNAGTLFLVGTPIGNLGDMTDRARQTLAAVDLIAAEDTRRTGRLMKAVGLDTRLVSFFEGNERQRTEELLGALRAGRDVAVVSDAGMPGLSDPGFRLVRACAGEGIDVRVVPGPSAAIAALVVSGLPTDRFAFEGFSPRGAGERRARLAALAEDPRTLVFYESARRVRSFLRDVLEVVGDRRVAVARELTKLHEEVIRGPVSEVLAGLERREPKGELVVVLEGAPRSEAVDVESLLPRVRALIAGGARKREAVGRIAREEGVSANALYRALLDADAAEARD